MIIKNTFLSNSDNASEAVRKELLESCNLYTMLDCPGGTFIGAGVKTVVLFFEKGSPTRKIWYYRVVDGLEQMPANVKSLLVKIAEALPKIPLLATEAMGSAKVRANSPFGGAEDKVAAKKEIEALVEIPNRMIAKCTERFRSR